ncbi:OmpA family protein [Rhodobacter sp. NSM]|uniref:OmpA family protein n=1 Tax=Rhodobacter sp. NSM TaxID=3457501 RepID=UPI003FD34952
MRPIYRLLLLGGCLGLAPAAAAEDLTDEQLLALFHRQRDAFSAAESGNGMARGLKLVTVDRIGPAPAVGDVPASLGTPVTEGMAGVPATRSDPLFSGDDRPGLGTPQGRDRVAVADQQTPPPRENAEVMPVASQSFGLLDPALQVNVRVRFAFDSALLSDDQKPLLAQLCSVMKASDIRLFQIVGHTDAAGSDAYNRQLSLLRAKEVRRYLVDDCGIDGQRLRALGMGERFLANTADPRSGDNRRVEFQAMS